MSYYFPPGPQIPESRHAAVGAWFFGPRAENFPYLERIFKYILEKQKDARHNLFPNDKDFISPTMQASPLFQAQIERLESELATITTLLSQHSVPFWSPRYNAHMLMENSMPAVIGYLTGLLHNQNNVATEASPVTTLIENYVGQDLCKMLGYNIEPNSNNIPIGWGHITCGGSVANLESIWAARNLKFYPFSLSLAISEGSLKFLNESGFGSSPRFEIELCTGEKKPFMECSNWELLNLKPSTVLDIPDQLANTYGISQTALGAAMSPYLIQTTGKDYLEKKFKIDKPAHFYVGTTKHYSWPKGAAIVGIGSEQIIDVPVDLQARMDANELRKLLETAVSEQQALYAVVAIIGSTEQGAVDPLVDILALRTEFEKRGLSFVVHCDGAWGGYFATMIREPSDIGTPKGQASYVPTLCLSPYTAKQLHAYKHADSITIDPHKSGYCPYPAGGLCYRDGRMRYLVTWTSPVVFRQGDTLENIGVYGVEGSKPGAAPVGAYLSHRVLGLHHKGYGTLLGEAIFSCSRLYCHWAAMKTEPIESSHGTKARLIVRPLDMLPTEKNGEPPHKIEEQKQFIRDRILNRDNSELAADKPAITLLQELGGDLMINAFACNFEIDGKINEDVVEANYLNARIYQRLSVSDASKDVSTVPILLTSTSLAQTDYKNCLTHFKSRLGLKGDQDLYVLINVTMSPWPTTGNFIATLAEEFQVAAEKEMLAAVYRNVEFPSFHGFVMQGTDQICGVHLPMFNMENHRTQLIISCDVPADVMEEYRKRKAANPTQFFTFGNKNPAKLVDLIKDGGSFEGAMHEGLPHDKKPISDNVTISNIRVLLKRSLRSQDLQATYPDKMVFYAYGRGSELHMDHLLNVSPNIQLNSERIQIVESNSSRSAADMIAKEGGWLRLVQVNESSMQPLIMDVDAPLTSFDYPGLPFKPGTKLLFEGFAHESEALDPKAKPVIHGTLALGPSVFADSNMLNKDGGAEEHEAVHALTMDSRVNGGALAAEYPNPGASQELQNLYKSNVMHSFQDTWTQLKQEEAQKRVKAHEGKGASPAPPWVGAWLDEGKKSASKRGAHPIRMYHGGGH